MPSVSNLFFLFLLLLIIESPFSINSKAISTFILISVVFTSSWTNYLFFNSLLGEGVVGYIYGVLIFELFNLKDKFNNRQILRLISLLLGTLVFGKNFLTAVSLFSIFLIFIVLKKDFYLFIFGSIPFIISLINFIFT